MFKGKLIVGGIVFYKHIVFLVFFIDNEYIFFTEYQERIPCDATRQNQLYYSTAKQGHPIAKFLFGMYIFFHR